VGRVKRKNGSNLGANHPASTFAPAWVSDHPNHLGILPSPFVSIQPPHSEAEILSP
jgi:hypothetical protein